ncbi:conserved hypothetical protein [Histoplasma capsulatum H143]|uniref:HNH nuclease domain-containing protein n=1 Tax=Ajellomyces capsulatus (strain H143) TaxID=544712 RepID=C6H4G5_AJECH|nr:conserved hypothetical protein [Histoplasma capsulatum H143]
MASQDSPSFETFPIPPCDLRLRSQISFCHPGYEEPMNTLLFLPRVDPVPPGAAVAASSTPTFGVHHRTALVACQIIANNAFDTGYFTLDKDGLQRVNIPPDGILTGEKYYLILGDGPSQYPIVPSFLDWEFPHGRIPEPWNQVPVTASSTTPDCAVTNFSLCTEQAHIVPREEETWYVRNGMGIYGANLGDINEATNVLPLRSDIHRCFDNRWFVIVPKTAGTEVSTPAAHHSPQFVTHIISTDMAQYWPTYHNTLVQRLRADCRPYLFARFAWAVLLHVKPLINSGIPRHIIRVQMTSSEGQAVLKRKAELLTGAVLKKNYGGGSSKRAIPLGKSAVDDGSLVESGVSSDASMDGGFWGDMMYEWNVRGTRRRKQVSSETDPDMMPSDNDKTVTDMNETPVEDSPLSHWAVS